MVYKDALHGSINPSNIFEILKFRKKFYQANPTYFDPDGLTIFVGPQGSGKTLSAVKYVEELLKIYSHSKLVTNLELQDYPIITFEEYLANNNYILPDENDEEYEEYKKNYFYKYIQDNKVFPFINADDLKIYSNNKEGVIFLIDEIQLYFNSLASKNIDPDVMVQISQQRKQRKHIVATSQVFGRMAKPLREQFSSVILCKKYFTLLQKNQLLDRDSLDGEESTGTNITGKVIKSFWWFHNPKDYGKYDTYKIIDNDFKNSKGVDLYDNRLSSGS